jgi:hypothetical protein
VIDMSRVNRSSTHLIFKETAHWVAAWRASYLNKVRASGSAWMDRNCLAYSLFMRILAINCLKGLDHLTLNPCTLLMMCHLSSVERWVISPSPLASSILRYNWFKRCFWLGRWLSTMLFLVATSWAGLSSGHHSVLPSRCR